jgi:hypothetical protein
MSDGERVERLISDLAGPKLWYGRPTAEAPPLEIRMIPAFGAIEYNLSNGGWAQFLWNCFYEWREVITIAREGYLLIGAPEQSAALDELWTLCERDEQECREAIQQETWLFAEFTSRSYSAPSNGWEELFYGNDVYEKRLAWLAANEDRVLRALGMPGS